MKTVKILFSILSLVIAAAIATSCGSSEKKSNSRIVFASIAPLADLVEQIADSSVQVMVLVPETTSPETYDTTPTQMKQLSKADIYVSTGVIDFERAIIDGISEISQSLRIVDLSKAMDVKFVGSCGIHHDEHGEHGEHSKYGKHNEHDKHDSHDHGIDPHTWLSPRMMRKFADSIRTALDAAYPEHSQIHARNLQHVQQRIDSLDNYIRSVELPQLVAIAHPSLTYFADDYGLEQLSIEKEGKEPTAEQMTVIINRARANQIKVILYQRQTSDAAALTIAAETGARVVEFDPLKKDWIGNLRQITAILSAKE